MLRGVLGGGFPLAHCMKPWYMYVNSLFIILVIEWQFTLANLVY